jgi:hypothetical protein
MSEGIVAALLTALGAVGGGAATYWAKRRTTSGTVQTTEAKDLWSEASSMRLALRDEIAELRAELSKVEGERDALRKENGELWARTRAQSTRGVPS